MLANERICRAADQYKDRIVLRVGRQRKNFPVAKGFRKVFDSTVASGADPGQDVVETNESLPVVQTLAFLLMAIFAQALFALMGGNFMSFTFLSARHTAVVCCE